MRTHAPLVVAATIVLLFAGPSFSHARDIEDLLDAERLSKELKAEESQREAIARTSERLESIVRDYQWERGKLTSEALAWEGGGPSVKALHEMRRTARESVNAELDSLEALLSAKQKQRLKKLRKDGNLLQVGLGEIPFTHLNNTPFFTKFSLKTTAHRVTLPVDSFDSLPTEPEGWSYADLLHTWSVRGYIPDLIESDGYEGLASSDVMVRDVSPLGRGKMVQSPLLLSATLLTPDLARSEMGMLAAHHHPEADKDSLRAAYVESNRLESHVLVRLKMSTPFAKSYMDLKRWIIYLENDEGTGYEPVDIEVVASRPIEALEIKLPSRQAEVTDVYGNYYPYVAGNREIVMLQGPSRVVYTGHEKLLKLFFAGRTFQGDPLIDEDTKSIKLIVSSEENAFGRAELLWKMDHSRPEKPSGKNRR